LSGEANSAPPDVAGFWGGEKGKREGKGGKWEGKKEENPRGGNGKKTEGKEGKGKGGILCSCDFSWRNPGS